MTAQNWSRIAQWAVRLVLFAVLGLIGFAIAVLIVIPRATHGAALNVLTGSMTPGIPVGSVVVERPVDPGTLKVGDIATYQAAPGHSEFITHRIVKIDTTTKPASFTFKGDANRGEDMKPVPATAIRGKVWFHVPMLGALRDTLHTGKGLSGVAMLVLAGYALVQARGALRDRRAAVTASTAVADPVELWGALAGAPAIVDLAFAPTTSSTPLVPILAVLRSEVREGVSAGVFASLWGAVLLEEDAATGTFTMLLAEPVERAQHTSQLLASFEPVSLHISQATAPSAPEELHAHA